MIHRPLAANGGAAVKAGGGAAAAHYVNKCAISQVHSGARLHVSLQERDMRANN